MPNHRDLQQHLDELAVYIDTALDNLQPRDVCVEIGLYRGGTHFVWCQLFGEVISIDNDYWACCKALLEFAQVSSKVLYGDSRSGGTVAVLGEILGGRPIDHLFIDASHHYEAVRWDFTCYQSFVRSGGVIGLHDAHREGTGVGRFLRELEVGSVEGWPASFVHDISYYEGEYSTGIAYVYKP